MKIEAGIPRQLPLPRLPASAYWPGHGQAKLSKDHPSVPVHLAAPVYATALGAAYICDSLQVLNALPDSSVNAVITSPPYALHFKKEYGNVDKDSYVSWMLPFAREIKRVLADDGSFILNIGGSYNPGQPTRSLYHFKLLIALCEDVGFHLAQECFWYNPAKLPAPAEWVNVRRARIKDSVEYVWWLSKTPWPRADNRNVLAPYSEDMKRLIKRGYTAKKRPSGHNITNKFQRNLGGSIPANLIERGNNESNSEYIKRCQEYGVKVHPARFPPPHCPSSTSNFSRQNGDWWSTPLPVAIRRDAQPRISDGDGCRSMLIGTMSAPLRCASD